MTAYNDEERNEVVVSNPNESVAYLESTFSTDDYKDVMEKLSNAIVYSTRASGVELTESEAEVILNPLTINGEEIQQQLL